MSSISEDRLAGLPSPVRRALERSGVLEIPVPDEVLVRQRGRIRTSPTSRWLGFTATERFTLDPPSLEWDALLKVGGIGVGRARDAFASGRGSMKVRLLGILTAVDAAGPEMDQGALMRWLNETMWFPAVWATDALTWEPIDEERARAHVMVAGHGAEAEFQFDPEGRLVNFHADRCRSVEDGFVMTPWSTPLTDHQRFGTVELPSAGSGVWTVEDGDFEYVQITVLDVDYSSSDA